MNPEDRLRNMLLLGSLIEEGIKDPLIEAKSLGHLNQLKEASIQVEASTICIRKALDALSKIPKFKSWHISTDLEGKEVSLLIYSRMLKEVINLP